jgi:hypothetical protein
MFRFVRFVLSEPVWNRFFGLLSTLVLAIPVGELVGSFCAFDALCCFGLCNAVVVAPRERTALLNMD